MNKYLKILLVASVLAYPASIQADAILMESSSMASSTAVVAPMAIPAAKTAAVRTEAVVTQAPPAVAATTSILESKLVYITAYASVPEETSDHPFITASGETVADGIVAANFLPFGTKIQIPALFGDKVFTVEDRMNKMFNGRVDIWMPTVAQAVNFGLRHAKIVILDSEATVK